MTLGTLHVQISVANSLIGQCPRSPIKRNTLVVFKLAQTEPSPGPWQSKQHCNLNFKRRSSDTMHVACAGSQPLGSVQAGCCCDVAIQVSKFDERWAAPQIPKLTIKTDHRLPTSNGRKSPGINKSLQARPNPRHRTVDRKCSRHLVKKHGNLRDRKPGRQTLNCEQWRSNRHAVLRVYQRFRRHGHRPGMGHVGSPTVGLARVSDKHMKREGDRSVWRRGTNQCTLCGPTRYTGIASVHLMNNRRRPQKLKRRNM